MSARLHRLAPWLVLAVAVSLLALRLYRLRTYIDFGDEDDNVTVGWLLTQGETLYGSVFSHHMPLAYASAQLVAALSPTDRPAHFRAFPLVAYAALALAIARSPLYRSAPWAGTAGAVCFVACAGVLLPLGLTCGHALLADSLWGVAFAVFVVLALLPFLLERPLHRRDAALGGAALALAPGYSLIAVYPALAALGLVGLAAAVSRGHRQSARAAAAPFLLGLLATGVATAAWLARCGSPAGFYREAILFNFRVYSWYFPRKSSPLGMVLTTFADWWVYLRDAASRAWSWWEADVVFAALTILGIAGLFLVFRPARTLRLLGPALLAIVVLLTRMRGGEQRALPLHVLLSALAGVLLAELWRAGHARAACAAAGTLGLSLFALAGRDASFAWSSDVKPTYPLAAARAASYVRARTAPGERIAALNFVPIVYLLARRRPAHDAAFYLPWQARWEAESARAPDTCAQLRRARPRFVVLHPWNVWGVFPWEEYGACIDRLLREEYRQVPEAALEGLVWERGPERAGG